MPTHVFRGDHVKTTLVSLGFALLASSASAKAPADQAKLFDYAKSSTPALAMGTIARAKCCNVTEWKLPSSESDGAAIEFTAVKSLTKGKRPVVLWLHREGQEVRSNSFLLEAEALAAVGVGSVLIELPFQTPYSGDDPESIVRAVTASRLVLDWAATQPEFDMTKVGIVGHRFGAWVGAILAGVDSRIDAAVLMSPPGKPSGWLQVSDQPKAKSFRTGFHRAQWLKYLNAVEPLDPERWIGFAAPAKLHFQFGSNDQWVPTMEQVDLFRAASAPKTRMMVESDEMLNDDAKKDRFNWLKRAMTGK
jgi:pimeloyl-ACP methyl ester carboxylesterase